VQQMGQLLHDSREAGLLAGRVQERLEDALELGLRPVGEVLLARDRLVTADSAATPRQIEELVVRTGFSRFPVLGSNGAFLGYLHVKDVLELDEREEPVPQRLWRPIIALPEAMPLDDALGAMRRAASHLAAVVDGNGLTLGLVTMEDVLEELVGEVVDPDNQPVDHAVPPAKAAR
jgi:CBS domain containing-hemolysin-like protein